MTPDGVIHHGDRLRQVRRTGGVYDDPARAHELERAREQFLLQSRQLGHVVRGSAPAGLRTTPQRAESGARGVDEHPVETGLQARLASIGDFHPNG